MSSQTHSSPSLRMLTSGFFERSGDGLALAARLSLSAIFILSGVGKLTDASAVIGKIASIGFPLPEAAFLAAVATELLGGLLLIVGFKTRHAALALAIFCFVTALLFHDDLADRNQFIHFFKNLAMAGGLLQVAAFGPGRFSLDRK